MELEHSRVQAHVQRMRRLPAVLLAAATALALLFSASVHGAEKKKKKKAEPEPVVSVISAVNGNTVDVTVGTATKTLKISQFTEIRLNGQKGSAADLQPGMTVSEVVLGADPSVASRINVAGSPAAAAAPTPEKKKRKAKTDAADDKR